MTLRLVVFDVDGTLVDSQQLILGAMGSAFAALDLPCPPRAQVLGIVGLSLPVAMARLAPDLGAADQDRMVTAYRMAFGQMRLDQVAPLYPGARAALDLLAQDRALLLGVATGKSRRGLAALLDAHGLADRFVTLQVADDHPSKPHPSMLLAALSETGVDAADAVMVGDTSFDMEMARSAGIMALGVGWGYHPVAQLRDAGAAQVIDGFEALCPALAAHWQGAA